MRYLTLDEMLAIHFRLVEDFGGMHGISDEGRLQSVLEAPRQELFAEEQYPAVHEKAAVYIRNIIGDHPFHDGNKRSGITIGAVFLMRNGYKLTAAPKELEDFAVKVATDHLDVPAIAEWLQRHSAGA